MIGSMAFVDKISTNDIARYQPVRLFDLHMLDQKWDRRFKQLTDVNKRISEQPSVKQFLIVYVIEII